MMKNKLILTIILGMFLISCVSASLGTFKAGDCVDIKTILNTSAVTISSLSYPNSSIILYIVPMTKNGLTFNYSFCNTSTLGTYNYDYNDTEGNVYINDFKIGKDLTTGTAILNLGFLAIIILLLIVTIMATTNLPSGNDEDGFGQIINVNSLKYLNYGLYLVSYGLLIAVFFLSSNIALAYITDGMFGQILFKIYQILMLIAIPFVILILIMIFVNIFKDKEVKNMLEQGIPVGKGI
jgi:hypothetical protein